MAYVKFGSGEPGASGEAGQLNDNSGAVADFLGAGGNGGDSGGNGGDAGGGEFDPAVHIGRDKRNADGSYRRKRGRKSNSTANRSRSKADNQASIEGLTRVLAILHVGVAAATKTPELALKDEEAENLAKATATVLEEFDIRPDPKIEAIVGLCTAAGLIYGPRIYMIGERKKREAQERKANNHFMEVNQ